ncbi:MAG: hypothetical protein DMG15_21550 [Acidobacteria bacterium]|nr:MAG: hypothetical protein DMG16_29165 [Acidobacteriota bacterium]PYS10214.1 MAG: hypothetical protein DMG15_21550 [Acidobacteriota bacterium]
MKKAFRPFIFVSSTGNRRLEIVSLFHPKKFPMKQLPILEFTIRVILRKFVFFARFHFEVRPLSMHERSSALVLHSICQI